MALNFPAGPAIGQIYADGGRIWKWDGSAWILQPARVLDDDTFMTATATDPPSAESTKAYVDNRVATKAPLVNWVYIPPGRFAASVGTPTRTNLNGSDAWSFATAANNGIVGTVAISPPDGIPAHWVTARLSFLWANPSATTGQVRWQARISGAGWSMGDPLPTITPDTAVATTSGGVQFYVEETVMGTITIPGEDFLSVVVQRNGVGETGGVANAVSFLGARITKVT